MAPDVTLPVRVAIQGEVARLRSIERFHENAEWYVAPLGVGLLLMFWGGANDGTETIGTSVIVIGICGLGVFANRRGLRVVIRPVREELETWLGGLEAFDFNGADGDDIAGGNK